MIDVQKLNAKIADLNTTNLKVYVAVWMAVATGLVYLGLAVTRVILVAVEKNIPDSLWEPNIEWLAFIAAMLADSTVQFIGKRTTHADYQAGKAAREATTEVETKVPGA